MDPGETILATEGRAMEMEIGSEEKGLGMVEKWTGQGNEGNRMDR